MRPVGLALVVFFAFLLAACAGEEEAPVSPAASPVASPTLPTAAAPVATAAPVSFITEDNLTIEGRLFGTGETAVIFAHMFPNDQRAWWKFAGEVGAQGYTALTFDFRGYGETRGRKDIPHIDRDLIAAVRYLHERDYQRVILVGASMGGTAALKAAARDEFEGLVAGVVAVSAPGSFRGLVATDDVVGIEVPVLFVASEGDGSAVESLESLYERASGFKERQVYPGDAHGTELLEGEHAGEFRALLFDFFRTVSLQ